MSSPAALDRARRSYARQAWADAYESFSAADQSGSLRADEIELLATCAYMLGREEEYLAVLQRAHRNHLHEGHALRAVRCAFWVGVNLARRGEMGRAGGWLGRAQRVLEQAGGDPLERGYLLLPTAFEQEANRNAEAAAATLAEAAAIGEEQGDRDLFALAAHEQGHVLIKQGRVNEGVRLLDETMVAVTEEELSPIVSGIAYCGVILACQDAHEIRRAREWTSALSAWCEQQPDLVAFTGRCLVHRAEIMQLQGAWSQALVEAHRAGERCREGENRLALGDARYREGEIHRLRGNFDSAEELFEEASRHGREPQPGLALLRLVQGRSDSAAAAIRRVEAETIEPAGRASVLPAYIEITLAVGDRAAARDACAELEQIAAGHRDGTLGATAAHTRGAIELSAGNAREALEPLRSAVERWLQLDVPYEAARARTLIGRACRQLGDEESSRLELVAARTALSELGAAPDLAQLDSLIGRQTRRGVGGLTARELEVLRHLAAGETNKAIASELVLSVRTVDRHVSNIFAKLGISSRAAAAAYAHEHDLV